MSAQDAARRVLLDLCRYDSLADVSGEQAAARECARFVLAVDPANEALVETVARAIADASSVPFVGPRQRRLARAALAAIAQAAGGAA